MPDAIFYLSSFEDVFKGGKKSVLQKQNGTIQWLASVWFEKGRPETPLSAFKLPAL